MMHNNTTGYISYDEILGLRDSFRKAGGRAQNDFNVADNPGLKYFKIFFHFYNGSADTNDDVGIYSGGLLSPIFEMSASASKETAEQNAETPNELPSMIDFDDNDNLRRYTTAWTYLKLNNESERADRLVDFIRLLSNISTYSPWYFQSIEGLDSAIERKYVNDKEFKLEEDRQKISIKCLKDSVDDRIGTLLDLYRSIVYSQSMKRFILPANLRKFDMSIMVFESPIHTLHSPNYKSLEKTLLAQESESAVIGLNTQSANTTGSKSAPASYKYYEFHNCEFDYSSAKAAGSLNNADGASPEYTIDISFDDMYETRYNAFLGANMGDFVIQDLELMSQNTLYSDSSMDTHKTYNRLDMYEKGLFETMVGEAVGLAKNITLNKVTGAFLGNLYSFSLEKAAQQAVGVMQGDVLGTARAIQTYVNNAKVKNNDNQKFKTKESLYEPIEQNVQQISNNDIFEDATPYDGDFSMNTLAYNRYERKVTDRVISAGNMFKKQSMANNI